jgi:hypothetical protein
MEAQSLPTVEDYNSHTNDLVTSGSLTLEQAIILQTCYRRSLEGLPTNINFLMQATGLNWQEINWTCNGLVLKGALTMPEKKWYITKIGR